MAQKQGETINLITGRNEEDKTFGILVLDTLANLTFLTFASGHVVLNCHKTCGVSLDVFAYLLFAGCAVSFIASILFYTFRLKNSYATYMIAFGYYQIALGIFVLTQYFRKANDCAKRAPELNFLALVFGLFIVTTFILVLSRDGLLEALSP